MPTPRSAAPSPEGRHDVFMELLGGLGREYTSLWSHCKSLHDENDHLRSCSPTLLQEQFHENKRKDALPCLTPTCAPNGEARYSEEHNDVDEWQYNLQERALQLYEAGVIEPPSLGNARPPCLSPDEPCQAPEPCPSPREDRPQMQECRPAGGAEIQKSIDADLTLTGPTIRASRVKSFEIQKSVASEETIILSSQPTLARPSVGLQSGNSKLFVVNGSRCTESTAHLEYWQQDLIDLFTELDADGSGSLSIDELRTALVAAGLPRARLAKIINIAHPNESGEIDVNAWIHAITQPPQSSGPSELRIVASILEEKKQNLGSIFDEAPITDPFMLSPLSPLRMGWDFSMSLICMYIAIFLPFTVAWEDILSQHTLNIFLNIDRGITCFFIFDIFVNFRTGYFNRSNLLVMRWKKCAGHYAKTWLLFDFVSSFPFEEVWVDMPTSQPVKLLKMIKFVRILKLMKPRLDLEAVSDIVEDLLESKIVRVLGRKYNIFAYVFLICHILACGMKLVDTGFLTSYRNVGGQLWPEYTAALYWGMTTISTVGYGDIIPLSDGERLYATAAMAVGSAFYGYVVGAITSMVSNHDLNASAYYHRLDLYHAWLSLHKFPKHMQKALRNYFKSTLRGKSAVNEEDIWQDLSPELQREIGEFLIHEDVKNNPVFDGLGIGAVVRMQSTLRSFTIPAGRTITTRGEVGTAMYIIDAGWLQMIDMDDSKALGLGGCGSVKLGPGQSFGEEVLLGLVEIYEYKVTVLERASLKMILQSEFLKLFQSMPNDLERMCRNTLELHPHLAVVESTPSEGTARPSGPSGRIRTSVRDLRVMTRRSIFGVRSTRSGRV